MSNQEQAPSTSPRAPFWARLRLGRRTLWAGAVLFAAAAAILARGLYHDHMLQRGEELSREIAAAAEASREASAKGESARAEVELEKALGLLRSSEQTRAHPAYVAVLVDLSSLRLGNADPTAETLAEVRKMLAEAWALSERAEPALRARIARERGLTELLDGKTAEARQWYQTAADILPEDEAARARLKLIGRIGR